MCNYCRRNAFTLVELLAVMVVLSIMAGMIVTTVRGVTQSARKARTKSILAIIDSVLLEKYEGYKYRPFAVEIPDTFSAASFTTTASSTEIGFDVLGSEAARVRLMMIRDMQRMELPDRLSDISSAPTLLRAAANPVLRSGATDTIVDTRADKSQRRMFQVSWYDQNASFSTGGDNVPSKLAAYRDRIPSSFGFTATASLENQGAECLYLIMSTSYVGGSPAIDAIPQTNLGDTDGDGLQEILDGWGQPLHFIRWPVGYFDSRQAVDSSMPDDFDLFRSDYSYYIDSATSTIGLASDVSSVPPAKVIPWSLRPLIFSSGADGNAGIATNPWDNLGVEQTSFSYQHSDWNWPVVASYYGPTGQGGELSGRARGIGSATHSEHAFPDPYLRRFVASNESSGVFAGLLPGQLLMSATANDDVSDNITNYQLQVETR